MFKKPKIKDKGESTVFFTVSYKNMINEIKKYAIASLSNGIVSTSISVLSIIFSFFSIPITAVLCFASIICGILAIIFSSKSLPMGRAVAGLVLGIIGVSIAGLVVLCHITLYFLPSITL